MRDYIFNKVSVKWRLISGISILLFFIVLAGTGGLVGMHTINSSLSDVYEKNITPFEELRDTNDLFAFMLVNTVNQLKYQQISWDEGSRRIEHVRHELDSHWATIQKIRDRSYLDHGEDWLREAHPLVKETSTVIGELLEAVRAKNLDMLKELQDKKLTPLALQYRQTINQLIKDRIEATKNKYEHAQAEYRFSEAAFFLTILAALIAGVGIVVMLLRSIHDPMSSMTSALKEIMKGDFSRPLDYDRNDEFGVLITGFNQMRVYLSDLVKQVQRSGIQVTSSITEIAATTKEQETTANEHAATTSEIAASSTQIAATSSSLLSTMKRVNSLTRNTAFASEEGHKGLLNINNIMVKVGDATGSIVDKLSILNEKANNVAGVVKTINKVADQTNLLSLNAAIEAEKAGEYGAGFAVVATEIRRLADQTAVATFDIEQMVHDVQSAVSSAVMGIDKFAEDVRLSIEEIHGSGEQLANVIEQVSVLMPQIETMNDGIEAQTFGAKQISDAISQLNEAAQQTADSLAQNSSAIAQLQQAAVGLQDAISRFKLQD